jgi:hypothetical protein
MSEKYEKPILEPLNTAGAQTGRGQADCTNGNRNTNLCGRGNGAAGTCVDGGGGAAS